MIGKKFRINFIERHAEIGEFNVAARCYLVDADGGKILPNGTIFSWSPNQYSSSINFESGYRGTQQWHSAKIPVGEPFWGVVEFPEPQSVSGIFWQGPFDFHAATRAPKAWSVERWNEATEQWELMRESLNEPVWTPLEIRERGLNSARGRCIDLHQSGIPRVVCFDWLRADRFDIADVSQSGEFVGWPLGSPYGIYYLSRDNRCPPIIHGPYTAE